MAKKTVLLKLESTAGTGYFYVKQKNPKKLTKKLEFMKFDPRAKKHVLFVEKKMK
jgi:large subunit ribosomal protein L33